MSSICATAFDLAYGEALGTGSVDALHAGHVDPDLTLRGGR